MPSAFLAYRLVFPHRTYSMARGLYWPCSMRVQTCEGPPRRSAHIPRPGLHMLMRPPCTLHTHRRRLTRATAEGLVCRTPLRCAPGPLSLLPVGTLARPFAPPMGPVRALARLRLRPRCAPTAVALGRYLHASPARKCACASGERPWMGVAFCACLMMRRQRAGGFLRGLCESIGEVLEETYQSSHPPGEAARRRVCLRSLRSVVGGARRCARDESRCGIRQQRH